jgi:serine protease Do
MTRFLRPRRAQLLAGGALTLALGATALAPFALRADAQPGPVGQTAMPLVRPMPGADFADLVARVAPSVVRVTVSNEARAVADAGDMLPDLRGAPFERFFRGQPPAGELPGRPAPRRGSGQGSGFIIDPAGYVVTNQHVIGRASAVKVELSDGRVLSAKVIGADPQTDLALLKVEAGDAPLPAVRFGDSDAVRVGEAVLAMGNPFGLGGTASTGILSARGRQIGAGPYDDFLQTDAAVNPGNSGGPLFNTAGEVIGITTAIFSPSGVNAGVGFAVPSKLAQPVLDQLRSTGGVERGWLGVTLQPLDEDLARAMRAPEPKGALVANVEPGSPAAKSGLRAGDVVIGFNGQPIAMPRDLALAVAGVKPGSVVPVALLRDGQRAEERLTIGRSPRAGAAGAAQREADGRSELGLSLAPLPEGRGGGAIVAQVRPGSPAAERGLRQGDVIRRAGNREVTSPSDVIDAVKAAREVGQRSVALQIERDEGRSFLAVPLA